MLLTGTFARAIDEKFRVAIPKPLREVLGGEAKVVLVRRAGDGRLVGTLHGGSSARLANQLGTASPNSHDVRAFGRLFYARAQAVELDGQGRVRIPPELAQLAGLNKEAMLIGVQDHLESLGSRSLGALRRRKTGSIRSYRGSRVSKAGTIDHPWPQIAKRDTFNVKRPQRGAIERMFATCVARADQSPATD